MKSLFLLLLIFFSPFTLTAQNYSTLSLQVTPRLEFPLGDYSEQFSMGGGGMFSANYKPPIRFPLYFGIEAGYTYLPVNLDWSSPIHAVIAGGGIGMDFRFLGRLGADIYVKGGYYEGFIENLQGETIHGGNPYLDTGASFSFYFTPLFLMSLGSAYREYFGSPASFNRSIGITLSGTYRFLISGTAGFTETTGTAPRIQFKEFHIGNIFPVFYKFYDSNPIGSATIENREKGTIENLMVSVFMKQYMDYPKTYAIDGELKRGESKEIDLYALFNEKVLEITEGAKVSTEFTLEYDFKGDHKQASTVKTVALQNRNASIWDDDQRAAAFITARDPVVLRLGKNLAGIVRESESTVFGRSFLLTLAIHTALSQFGINYVVDPNTPYEVYHQEEQAVDFLQFPRQSLEYKAGDCDDLSILYSALLEALSVETALVTVPGHIYIAVNLGMTPAEAKSIFFNSDTLVYREDKVWLPFEVTLVQDSFFRAWQEGAREWIKYEPLGQAGFYPVAEAWRIFEPVGLPGEAQEVHLPDLDLIEESFANELSDIITREIEGKVADLEGRITASSNNPNLINSLGILYARYGLYEKAEEQFRKNLKKTQSYSALVNVGNIRFMRKDYTEAVSFYADALDSNPGSPKVMINLARAYFELENYSASEKLFNEVTLISPDLADRYSYLGSAGSSGARASSAREKGEVLWED